MEATLESDAIRLQLGTDLKPLRLRSDRAPQRHAALWIAVRLKQAPEVPREVLRQACRDLAIYSTATFSYYMADFRAIHRAGSNQGRGQALAEPWFAEIKGAGGGWTLTEAGRAAAVRLFA